MSFRWRHNDRDGVSNHQPHDCLLNRLFRRRSKKTPKLRVTGLCARNSPRTGEFPAQMTSNAENFSISWRHLVFMVPLGWWYWGLYETMYMHQPWWRHQMETFSALLTPLWGEFPRSPVTSPHKGQWRGALMFSLICTWINRFVNNREAGDLRFHRFHYDVIVMTTKQGGPGSDCIRSTQNRWNIRRQHIRNFIVENDYSPFLSNKSAWLFTER